MATILHRYLFGFLMAILAGGLLLGSVYHSGYKSAKKACEDEKITIIQTNEQIKTQIIEKIRKKSVVERRKELVRYVIN